ncbi:RNA polymerase sigma factor [Botrimarina hoheduenensis]|uniref:RNA polymerase sigma factor n=2 Tax=Botrimarina hoheduenensis TaxID=2528000 RepID=A0A5C5WG26_9BACT|nr:RNA polymerase sigma factor [Botrimarina hoheduenensis]
MQDGSPSPTWLDALRSGDEAAAEALWSRYFERLAAVARVRLQRVSPEVSGDDIALSALKSVMLGCEQGRFPKLTDEDSLWPLLVTITARKAVDARRRHRATKRDAALTERPADLSAMIGQEPTVEFSAQVADELERLVTLFDDPSLRVIAQRKLEGYSHQEIAEELGCAKRTVIRKLERIRREWSDPEVNKA